LDKTPLRYINCSSIQFNYKIDIWLIFKFAGFGIVQSGLGDVFLVERMGGQRTDDAQNNVEEEGVLVSAGGGLIVVGPAIPVQSVEDGAGDDVERDAEPVHDVGAQRFGYDLTAQVSHGREVHADRDFVEEEGDETGKRREEGHARRQRTGDHRHDRTEQRDEQDRRRTVVAVEQQGVDRRADHDAHHETGKD